jgi:hypothetical protein
MRLGRRAAIFPGDNSSAQRLLIVIMHLAARPHLRGAARSVLFNIAHLSRLSSIPRS